MKSFLYKYNFLHAVFFIPWFNLLTFSSIFCFSKHHQSIKLSKNPDFVSPYLGPKCLQSLSANYKSLWKELNILINNNNCFNILKYRLIQTSLNPSVIFFVKSDIQGCTLIIIIIIIYLIFLPRRK